MSASWFIRQLPAIPSTWPRDPPPAELASLIRTTARVRPAVFPVAVDRDPLPDEIAALSTNAKQFPVLYVGGVTDVHPDGRIEVHVFERPSGRELFTTLSARDYLHRVDVAPGDDVSLYTWDELVDGEVRGRLKARVERPAQTHDDEDCDVELSRLQLEAAAKLVDQASDAHDFEHVEATLRELLATADPHLPPTEIEPLLARLAAKKTGGAP